MNIAGEQYITIHDLPYRGSVVRSMRMALSEPCTFQVQLRGVRSKKALYDQDFDRAFQLNKRPTEKRLLAYTNPNANLSKHMR